jgi:hypothetical protein
MRTRANTSHQTAKSVLGDREALEQFLHVVLPLTVPGCLFQYTLTRHDSFGQETYRDTGKS